MSLPRTPQVLSYPGPGRLTFLSFLFFLSGSTGLVLQVVWMYRLGLVFGNAVYATAATLAAFFLGLALGGWFWGNAAPRFRRPLTVYGLMELGVAVTALLWIPGLEFYESHYASVVAAVGGHRGALLFLKFVFSTTLLLVPAFIMGGTFPILAQYVGDGRRKLASRGTVFYAVNTIGASLGAFFAGFILLPRYGVDSTYFFAVALAAGIGIAAVVLEKLPAGIGFGNADESAPSPARKEERSNSIPYPVFALSRSRVLALAFVSGLLALSAEVIWTRMFAQVLQNSVYSFSAILVVFLIALGVGGLLSHILVRLSLPTVPVLLGLLYFGALLIALSPVVFDAMTDGLGYIASRDTWGDYLWSVFRLTVVVVFPPTVIFGAIFPYLLKASPTLDHDAGRFVGELVLFNSLGSTIGPILAGFILLNLVGLWTSIKIVAVAYAGLTFIIASSSTIKKNVRRLALPTAAIAGVIALSSPPTVRLEPGEKIAEMWQSSAGVVSVVESADNLQMRMDNYYVLGDTRSALVEQMQAHIPLMIHPSPGRILFLGMGTGITPGAALNHAVDRVVTVELVSNVISASKKYFSPWVNGLFHDPRVEIVADDGRNFLLGTTDKFDVIIGDLFTPWHAGTGSLYTSEHFQLTKEHTAPGGIVAQWLPLYQLTPESFDTIVATFASVFEQVTLWRADFSGSRASVVLIGQEAGSRLDQGVLQNNISNVVGERDNTAGANPDHMAGLYYIGNLDALRNRMARTELNTDNKRTIEFNAPILSQQANAGRKTYIVGKELDSLLETIATNLPAEQDPYLSDLPPDEIRYVKVGLLYFRYLQLTTSGTEGEALGTEGEALGTEGAALAAEGEAEKILAQIRSITPYFLQD